MANAQGYGIKLIVSFYSYNALEAKDENGKSQDFYGAYYGKTFLVSLHTPSQYLTWHYRYG